jgi:hypothetical protein
MPPLGYTLYYTHKVARMQKAGAAPVPAGAQVIIILMYSILYSERRCAY